MNLSIARPAGRLVKRMYSPGCLSLLLLLSVVFPAHAQVNEVDEVDRAFESAREMAFNGAYEDARELCREILEEAPDYHDVRILIARTWLWEGEYERARPKLEYVLEADPAYRDGLSALIDLERWSGHYEQALKVAERATTEYPMDGALLYRQADLLIGLNRYDEAARVLRQLESIGSANSEIRELRRRLAAERIRNRVEVVYTYDHYSEVFDSWQLLSARYERMTGIGPLLGKLNLADRFGMTALQGELDFYPRLGEQWYGYLNLGYSPDSVFPKWRTGVELHRLIGERWDMSLGVRYLGFDPDNVWIMTGSVGVSPGNWFLQLRPYFSDVDGGASQSMTALMRRYFESAESHLSLRTGFGFTPEERQLLGGVDRVELMKSQFVAVEYYQMIGWRVQWINSVQLARQDMRAVDDYVRVLTLMSGLSFRF